ncbi:RnfH family protein [Legionella nagasakiensis]|uniref:RnfH family protein n=1 Tax=Legionella nagasakiensis TaxID=535290 RepID=UPI00105635D1|nr:RnfH family protein [Legionella nagasakiensis]
MVNVEVVYLPINNLPVHLHLSVEAGTTVAQVLDQSGIQDKYPEIQTMAIGIFAKRVSMESVINHGDRIEIYRPLMIEPKEKRRERASRRNYKQHKR